MPRLLRPAWPLVACLAVALMWPASEVWYAWAYMPVARREVGIDVGPGWFGFTVIPIGRIRSPTATAEVGRITPAVLSYLAYPPVYSKPGDYRFWCPLWIVTIGAGLFAVGLIVSRRRRANRDRPGHCRACGYDLRASPQRCPECGAAVSSPD